MSPLELIVLIGIIIAFTAFAVVLARVSRANPAPRRVSVKNKDASHGSARPRSTRLILRGYRWFLPLSGSPIGTHWRFSPAGKRGAWRSTLQELQSSGQNANGIRRRLSCPQPRRVTL